MADVTPIPESPFTAHDLEQMNNALATGEKVQKQIDLAKRAGLDVAAHQEQLNKLMSNIQRIKSVYFPGA